MRAERRQGNELELATGHDLAWRGDWQGALERYKRAVDLQPQHAVARAFLALALARLSRLPQALQELQTALAGEPRNTVLLAKAAELQELLGEPRAAAATLTTLSEVLLRNGQREAANKAATRARQLLASPPLNLVATAASPIAAPPAAAPEAATPPSESTSPPPAIEPRDDLPAAPVGIEVEPPGEALVHEPQPELEELPLALEAAAVEATVDGEEVGPADEDETASSGEALAAVVEEGSATEAFTLATIDAGFAATEETYQPTAPIQPAAAAAEAAEASAEELVAEPEETASEAEITPPALTTRAEPELAVTRAAVLSQDAVSEPEPSAQPAEDVVARQAAVVALPEAHDSEMQVAVTESLVSAEAEAEVTALAPEVDQTAPNVLAGEAVGAEVAGEEPAPAYEAGEEQYSPTPRAEEAPLELAADVVEQTPIVAEPGLASAPAVESGPPAEDDWWPITRQHLPAAEPSPDEVRPSLSPAEPLPAAGAVLEAPETAAQSEHLPEVAADLVSASPAPEVEWRATDAGAIAAAAETALPAALADEVAATAPPAAPSETASAAPEAGDLALAQTPEPVEAVTEASLAVPDWDQDVLAARVELVPAPETRPDDAIALADRAPEAALEPSSDGTAEEAVSSWTWEAEAQEEMASLEVVAAEPDATEEELAVAELTAEETSVTPPEPELVAAAAAPSRDDAASTVDWLAEWQQLLLTAQSCSWEETRDRQAEVIRDLLGFILASGDGVAELTRLPGIDEWAAKELLELPSQRQACLLLALARGRAFQDRGLPNAAAEEFEAAICAMPDLLGAQIALGRLYQATGRREAAAAKYAALAKLCEVSGEDKLYTEMRARAAANA